MHYYVRIDGGIGRCIAASGAVIEFFKTKTGGVITSVPDVFENLGLSRVYPISTPFLYEDKIRENIYLEPEPYNNYSYYGEEKHLSRVFNLLLNNKDEFIDPVIRLTENEKLMGQQISSQIVKDNKKIILVQPYGSSGGNVNSCDCDGKKEIKATEDESYRSFSYEFTDYLIECLSKTYTVVLIKLPNQRGHPKATSATSIEPIRKVISLIPYSAGVICCDSFLHHASAALGTPVPTVVLWAGTNPKNLSYEKQKNIVTNKKVEFEPLRIPHNHLYYLDKNRGSNDFSKEIADEVINMIKGE